MEAADRRAQLAAAAGLAAALGLAAFACSGEIKGPGPAGGQPAMSAGSDVYTAARPTKVRTGFELLSPEVRMLAVGERVRVLERHLNSRGQMRLRCSDGWVSEISGTGERLLAPPGIELLPMKASGEQGGPPKGTTSRSPSTEAPPPHSDCTAQRMSVFGARGENDNALGAQVTGGPDWLPEEPERRFGLRRRGAGAEGRRPAGRAAGAGRCAAGDDKWGCVHGAAAVCGEGRAGAHFGAAPTMPFSRVAVSFR